MRLPQYLHTVRRLRAVRRVVPTFLLACVFALHGAVAQAPAPGAPSGLAVTAGNRSISLTWEDPGDDGITGYEYRVYADREQDWREWKAIAGATDATTGHTLPGLTNRVVYRVQVRARNATGAGEPSETSAMPQAPAAEVAEGEETAADAPAAAAPPSAPNGLAATAGDGSISLTWEDPGDASITGYEYRVYADREQDWREWKMIGGATDETTGHTLDLTNGVLYRVQLRARNSAGAGEPSETSAMPQAPAAEAAEEEETAADAPAATAPPSAPNGLAATAGDGSISLTWEDPGDASITGYEYRVYADREWDWREWKAIGDVTDETTGHTLDLTNGVLYRVQLRARNSAGAGEPSETSAMPQAPAAEAAEEEETAADAPAATAPPSAPNGLAATAGDGSISLTWEDPGDASITGYEYRVYADREWDWREWKAIGDVTDETTGHTLDLTNGVLYRVQLRARNSAGAGEPSETSAMPQAPAAEAAEEEETAADAPAATAPPSAPNGLAATAGDGSISLTWEDPGDASITGYEYRVYADREWDWREWKAIGDVTDETTGHTLDLTNGVLYRVQLRARNSAGAGEPSETSAMPQAPAVEAAEEEETAAGTPAAGAPSERGAAPQAADGSMAAGEGPVIEELPRSGAPWIVIVVLAVCLAIGIVIVAMRMRGTAGGRADSQEADS